MNEYNCIIENVIRSRSIAGSAFVISGKLFCKGFKKYHVVYSELTDWFIADKLYLKKRSIVYKPMKG